MGIYIDEVGYFPNSKKRATVLTDGKYSLVNRVNNEVVLCKEASKVCFDATAGEDCYVVDFSELNAEGTYYIKAENEEKSADFQISNKIYDELMTDLVKCLHYQRCGCGLDEKNVGKYTRPLCHKEGSIFLKDYLDKVANPEKVDMTGGWHDAGDFGKYVSPAAVAIGHLLYSFEIFKDTMSMELNIPETGNGLPDVLNEIAYELEWMFKMQADNGGVYHKIAGFTHCPFIMPEEDKDQMLIFPISSMATADFAACMAIVSRVYAGYNKELSERALKAARKAFYWLKENDYVGFHNPEGSNTGEYDDDEDLDERAWAAAELLRTDIDGDVEAYKQMLDESIKSDIKKTDFGWTDVAGFASLSICTDSKNVAGEELKNIAFKAIFEEADRLVATIKNSGYELGMLTEDFVWGSNMVVTNRGMLLVYAAWLVNSCEDAKKYAKYGFEEYYGAAENHVHYILGRNALGRSYVTGYGQHAFKNPHNRVSACDGIDEVMPGWVSGGPFKDFMDPDALKLLEKGTAPQKCHVDVVGSYSTNEITIYWNSSMAALLAGVIGLYK